LYRGGACGFGIQLEWAARDEQSFALFLSNFSSQIEILQDFSDFSNTIYLKFLQNLKF